MADNKANALKEAKNTKLKVYYSGDTPEESRHTEVYVDALDNNHTPWLFKFYTKDGSCYQFADTLGVYRVISRDLDQILDAVIVNNKQREAVDKIISKMLLNYLGEDMAGEKDSILDPCEY